VETQAKSKLLKELLINFNIKYFLFDYLLADPNFFFICVLKIVGEIGWFGLPRFSASCL
jgi:hypothetical protein